MKITYEKNIRDFEFWGGAVYTYNRIAREDKLDELEDLLETCYEELDETELNDILAFEDKWIYESLDMETEGSLKEKIEDVEEQMEDIIDTFHEQIEDDELTDKSEIDDLWKEEYSWEYDELKEELENLNEELDSLF